MKHSKKYQHPDETHAEAMKIAKGTQRPGQTREQTKLIAQGIQKGIQQYRKQQSAKARELNRQLKRAKRQPASMENETAEVQEKIIYRQHWLPWVLLILSWVAMGAFWLVF